MKTTSTQKGINAETRSTQRSAKQLMDFSLCAAPRPWRLCVCLWLVTMMLASAATNDLSGLLQKGLFEEEANRNLDAASAAYQTLVTQFDKDRQIGATAVFRLGEVYRKQGKTNEAAAQYERIVRDFAEQTTLVTLSRQNLAGLGTRRRSANSPSDTIGTASSSADARMLNQLKKLSREELREVLPGVSADPTLSQLLNEFNAADKKRVELGMDVGGDHPLMKQTKAVLELLNKKIEERMDGILRGMELRVSASEAGGRIENPNKASNTAVTTVADEEEAEIRRIQAMIQNSPDLINAPRENGYTPLGRAAFSGWLRVVGFLLDNGAAIQKSGNNSTPLHDAVRVGNRAMVDLLAGRGANLEARDGTGGSPLHLAAESGYLSVAETLIQRKADLEARNDKSNGEQTPLERAAANGHPAMVAFLVGKGAQFNGAISRAAAAGHVDTVRRLIELGAPPDTESAGVTALGLAAENGHLEVVTALLAARTNPNASTNKIPLIMAAWKEHLGIAEHLLRAGADPNCVGKLRDYLPPPGPLSGIYKAPGSYPYTPLEIAVAKNNKALVALLLKYKADANTKASTWSTPASPLTFYTLNKPEMLALFLEAGADANAQGAAGWSLLSTAALSNGEETIGLLLKHGAKPDDFAADNLTPLARVSSRGCFKCVEVLLSFKANPNLVRTNTWTPLLSAIAARDRAMVELLIAHGADVNLATSLGWTPLHSAADVREREIMEQLLAKGAKPNVCNNAGETPLDVCKRSPGNPSPLGIKLASADEIAALLRQHGALEDLPDFTRIRVTRQGLAQPLLVFSKGAKAMNQFTLLETVMNFYGRSSVISNGRAFSPVADFRFPDFGRIIIRRPSQKPGSKDQEIKISLLNASNVVDCTKDVPVEFGDVVEIPERVHPLNEARPDPVREMEQSFKDAQFRMDQVLLLRGRNYSTNEVVRVTKMADDAKAATQRWACLQKSVQLVVAGTTVSLTVDSWQEGFLGQALAKAEARAALRSSSDLSRAKVTRKDAKSGKPMVLTADATDANDSLWLQDGDVIEVPDKL